MAYENWTGWTEYDPDGDYTVIANQITCDTVARNSEGQVWKNHGTDHFDDFTQYIDFSHSARDTKSCIVIWSMNNVNGPSAGDGVGLSLVAYSPDGVNSYAWLEDLGEATSDFCVLNLTNRYYIKIVRVGTLLTAYFYNDAAHTDLWNDIGPIACHTRPYSTIAHGASGNAESSATMTGILYNLDIGADVLTHIQTISISRTSVGTILDMTATLDLLAGDLIVACTGFENNSDPAVVVTVAQVPGEGGGNGMTMFPVRKQSSTACYCMGSRLSAGAYTGATFRFTLSSSADSQYFVIFQFRPVSGKAAVLDAGSAAASGSSGIIQTGNISTSVADTVCVAGATDYAAPPASPQIGEVAADENIPKEYFAAWRKAFSSIQTNIHAQAGASGDWATDIAAFRAVGGGLLLLLPVMKS